MTPSIASLGIDQLSVDQRIVLVQEIWNSIEAETRPPLLSVEQKQELERRLADHLEHPDDVVSWKEVETQALARVRE